jgi:putative hemolysin
MVFRSIGNCGRLIPDTTDALHALETLLEAEIPTALIHNEYGGFEGIVTPADVLEAIAGAFRSDINGEEPPAVRRADGSWLFAGWLRTDEMADQLGVMLPGDRDYQTVAGFVLAHLRHLPATDEHVDVARWRFEIIDLDGVASTRSWQREFPCRGVRSRRPE